MISCCDTIFSIHDNTITPFLTFNISKNIGSKLDDEKLRLHAYSQNEDVAFVKLIIGYFPYNFFYFFNTKKIGLFSYMEMFDDLTHLPINLLGIYGNTAIGTVSASNISYISSLIKDGTISSPEVKEYIRSQGNNTLLIFYEFKDDNNMDL